MFDRLLLLRVEPFFIAGLRLRLGLLVALLLLIGRLLLGVVLFWLPPVGVELVIGAIVIAGAWEWSAFLPQPGRPVRIAYVVLIALLLISFTSVLAPFSQELLLISIGWWLLALLWTFAYPTPIPGPVRWLAGALVLVPMFVALLQLYSISQWLLLFALLIVWVADTGAYFAGRFLGRVKLAPSISPGKTWEGVIGGMVAVALLAMARASATDGDWAILVPFCLGVGVVSIVGDLTVSMFKRTTGVKDSGTLFPGHGGVLDRVDSIAAAAPLFAIGTSWVGLK